MFDGFAHVWTPAALSRRVGRAPLGLTIGGEAIVLFRDAKDAVGALLDRCPHRGVALSLGRVGADGCLECAFHGWRFAGDGANRGVPLNPDVNLGHLGATALPVREVGELIWIYTAPLPAAPPELMVPDGLSELGLARAYVERDWRCHWTRAMENMLDSPHLPFVHRCTIGRSLRRRMTPTSRMDIAWEATPWGGRSRAILDGDDKGAVLEFHRPNIMSLLIPIPGRHLRIHALVIPAGPGASRLIVAGSRDFFRAGWLNPLFALMNARIADEDRAVVESSGPDQIPPVGAEWSVPTDKVTLEFRRYYHTDLFCSAA